nr:4Fe-4S binding protein [Candidatus Njordarchaeum guaymaensis]
MCDWCVKHGDGKIWYLNAKNYSRKMYKERKAEAKGGSDTDLQRTVLEYLRNAISNIGTEQWPSVKKSVEGFLHSTHFGQVVPLQDMEKVLDIAWPIATMTCACRRQARGLSDEENFHCMGIGVGMYKWERWPDTYRGGVNFIPPKEAKDFIQKLNKKGIVHTAWTFGTPYIGGICNCEYECCYGLRGRLDYDLKVLFKGHYVALLDPGKCNGCRLCVSRCQFGAIKYSPSFEKISIDLLKCFGCGLCETGCARKAIHLESRSKFPALANSW